MVLAGLLRVKEPGRRPRVPLWRRWVGPAPAEGRVERWDGLTSYQWVTPRYAAIGGGRRRLAALGTTPGELPGLVEARPDVALTFFRKAAAGLRVELREGLPWLSVKARGRPREGRPYLFCACRSIELIR
jgi:hypothetical protein